MRLFCLKLRGSCSLSLNENKSRAIPMPRHIFAIIDFLSDSYRLYSILDKQTIATKLSNKQQKMPGRDGNVSCEVRCRIPGEGLRRSAPCPFASLLDRPIWGLLPHKRELKVFSPVKPH